MGGDSAALAKGGDRAIMEASSARIDRSPDASGVVMKYHLSSAPILALFAMLFSGHCGAQTVINTVRQLQAINNNLSGNYVLGKDIAAGQTSAWNSGAGFLPIGSMATPFTGTFDGAGHTISGLVINSNASSVGLFGAVGGAGTVRNVTLAGGAIAVNTTPYAPVGALVGANMGMVSNSTASTPISGSGDLDEAAGGLVGDNQGVITGCAASGAVSGADSGGLVGDNSGQITLSYATGPISGGTGGYRAAGGLVGGNYGNISTSYATGNVTGVMGRVGGLAGITYGSITNAYAAGTATGLAGSPGNMFVAGGLVGFNGGALTAVYALGAATGHDYKLGGLVALNNSGTIRYGYWDITTSGNQKSRGGKPLTTAELQAALPLGFSSDVWGINAGSGFPFLIGVGSQRPHP